MIFYPSNSSSPLFNEVLNYVSERDEAASTAVKMFHVSGNCDYANEYSIDWYRLRFSSAIVEGEQTICLPFFFLRDGTVLSIKSIPERNENCFAEGSFRGSRVHSTKSFRSVET